jgi:regulatory protein
MEARRRQKKLDAQELWNYALRALGQRAHSVSELGQKLKRRASSREDVQSVIAKLREYGLTDDKKFSEALASARLQNQGFGRFRVLRELRSKNVAQTVAESAVDKTFSGTDELELIQLFLERKYRGKNLAEFLKEEKNLVSVYRRLRTAGFSSGASLSVLKRHATRVEEWNEIEEDE